MNPEIAAQFLGTIVEVSATIFAIYLATIIFVLQDKVLFQNLMKHKAFLISFGCACPGYCSLIVSAFQHISRLDLQKPYAESSANQMIWLFALSLSILILNFVVVMKRRHKLYAKQLKKEKKD